MGDEIFGTMKKENRTRFHELWIKAKAGDYKDVTDETFSPVPVFLLERSRQPPRRSRLSPGPRSKIAGRASVKPAAPGASKPIETNFQLINNEIQSIIIQWLK